MTEFQALILGIVQGITIPLMIGSVASVLSGFIAIAVLMKVIQKWSFTPFIVHRVVVGVLILVFLV